MIQVDSSLDTPQHPTGKTPPWGFLVVAVTFLGAIWLTLPSRREALPLVQDEWDYVSQLLELGPVAFVLRPTEAGHFVPVFKAGYGALMLALDFDTKGILLAQLLARVSMVAVWVTLLRRLRLWGLPAALCLVPLLVNEVGARDIYFWAAEFCHELVAFFAVALFGVTFRFVFLQRGSPSVISILTILCCWTFGSGVVPPVATLAALSITSPVAGRALAAIAQRALLIGLAIGACGFLATAQSRIAIQIGSPTDVVASFFVGTVLNSGLGGLRIGATPGIVNAASFVLLATGTLVLIRRQRTDPTTFLVLACLLTAIGVGLLVAVSRSSNGPFQASSYRYVFHQVIFQAPVAAMLGGMLRLSTHALLGTLVAGLALSGAVQGSVAHDEEAIRQRRCVDFIVVAGQEHPPCLRALFYRSDAQFIRRVARDLASRRAYKALPKPPSDF